ncbi:hypothetical protein Bealeia1_01512 [Candidatus Bealeia paramacronuclearis]|uniref:DUF2884 family protein n=1 Tax=Candidatus Bealeia paramacronuclearis TaxID=1921001 RepID=A0ABZ2C4K9_9PROT|nr:hypothetical protein [Candidatus Bealeia paramacronuclearis]
MKEKLGVVMFALAILSSGQNALIAGHKDYPNDNSGKKAIAAKYTLYAGYETQVNLLTEFHKKSSFFNIEVDETLNALTDLKTWIGIKKDAQLKKVKNTQGEIVDEMVLVESKTSEKWTKLAQHVKLSQERFGECLPTENTENLIFLEKTRLSSFNLENQQDINLNDLTLLGFLKKKVTKLIKVNVEKDLNSEIEKLESQLSLLKETKMQKVNISIETAMNSINQFTIP